MVSVSDGWLRAGGPGSGPTVVMMLSVSSDGFSSGPASAATVPLMVIVPAAVGRMWNWITLAPGAAAPRQVYVPGPLSQAHVPRSNVAGASDGSVRVSVNGAGGPPALSTSAV